MGAAALFNGMIAPLTPMTFRGVLWYQGESNVHAAAAPYAVLLQTLIADWRGRFAQTLPFGIVQLANYGNNPADTRAAIVRAAQAQVAAEVPDTGLTVAIDLGEERIHPPNKRNVANRLALWARAEIYGETNLVHQSPRYQSHSVQGGKIRIRFATGGSPLRVGHLEDSGRVKPAPGTKLRWFEIAGVDGKFVPAEAVIDGGSVVVSSPQVSAPTAVRYAWATNPSGCNLYNETGLPAGPFSTGAATSPGL
jgi:sialate O-acetylesterase